MTSKNQHDLILALDMGHSSIGWSITGANASDPEILGLGTLIFQADGCLASKRRDHRRQRRTIRSRRQRVDGLEKLCMHQGLLTEDEVAKAHRQGGGDAAPWLLGSAVLASGGSFKLTALELFNVLRWYAHNRGYDGNRRWARNIDDGSEDTKREDAARALMQQYGTRTMAETIAAHLGLEPGGNKRASTKSYKDKDVGAAFPRSVVEREVGSILDAHIGEIPGCTEDFKKTLCGAEDEAWRTIEVEGVKRPKSYAGGLLFGQKVPRFDNRILSYCPVTNKPVPLKSALEYLEFRCAMFFSNVRVRGKEDRAMRLLNAQEIQSLWSKVTESGYFTKTEFIKSVRQLGEYSADNLEALMTIDDSQTNCILDPALKLTKSNKELKGTWSALKQDVQDRYLAVLRKGRPVSLAEILSEAASPEVEEAISAAYKKAKKHNPDYEKWLQKPMAASFDSGRAPYGRDVMRRAVKEVLDGRDPRAKGGSLYLTVEMQERIARRSIDQLTNNHLVRHRILLLERLVEDVINEYCDGDAKRLGTVVIEVNREVSEMAGKTMEQIRQEEGIKRADHRKARKALESAVEESGESIQITAGLIRKARIAQDLDWTCPYTGKKYGPMDLVKSQVDLDHIIPRSERLSDSMAGLVVTWSEVNKWKANRTALRFVQEEQGKSVAAKPQLSIISEKQYEAFVSKLKTKGGAGADEGRRKARKQYLLLPEYQDKEFTPRDLTISSYVTKLAMQAMRKRFESGSGPGRVKFVSLPGRLTAMGRRAWKLLGLLSAVADEINEDTLKEDIRGITHLHHALDASTMGLMAYYIPNLADGTSWQYLLQRTLMPEQAQELKESVRIVRMDSRRRPHLQDVPPAVKEQIRERLQERRVVQHVPSSMDGLRVEENTRGIVKLDSHTGRAVLRQSGKLSEETTGKLLGVNPTGRTHKLQNQNGVRVINSNFGVILTENPEIVPWHKVWHRLNAHKEKTGKWPQVLRNGMAVSVPEGTYKGVWRINSIKNNKAGLALDMSSIDGVAPCKINARLSSILTGGMRILKTTLSGDTICRTISSILESPK